MTHPTSIDLHGTLADLAGSVHDDALADRLTRQVGPMVGRVRRRRAARATAVGAVSMGTVAAVTVGAVALANRGPGTGPAPLPPATDAPVEPDAPDGAPLGCGDVVPDTLAGTADGIALRDPLIDASAPYGDPLGVTLLWEAVAGTVTWDSARVDVAVARDGLVVGTASASEAPVEPVTMVPGEAPGRAGFADDLAVVACGGDTPLEPGAYEVVATVTLVSPDGATRYLSTGPWPFTVLDPADPATDEQARAQAAAVADIVEASERISAEYPFGVCGTRVPVGDERLLAVDLDLGAGPYAAGTLLEGTAGVAALGDRTVLGNAPATSAHVILTRDGVVVGRGDYDPEHVSLITFTADDPYPLPALGNALLCALPGADAPELDLPDGVYQAYGVLEVALKEVQEADGTAYADSRLVVARSEPVDVVIGAPAG